MFYYANALLAREWAVSLVGSVQHSYGEVTGSNPILRMLFISDVFSLISSPPKMQRNPPPFFLSHLSRVYFVCVKFN